MSSIALQIPLDHTPRIEIKDDTIVVHFEHIDSCKRPLEADESSVDVSVDAASDDGGVDAASVKGKMARKAPDVTMLAFARRLVAATDTPAELTRIFEELHAETPGGDHIEKHRKFVFQIAKGQNSVLSLAQEIDPSIGTFKMGSIEALREYNVRKIEHQDATEQVVQQTGKVQVSNPRQLHSKLVAAAKQVAQEPPFPESILLAEDLLAFSLALRSNEACPLKLRCDGHQLTSADFDIEHGICTFRAGSKTHDGAPRAPFEKVCLFADDIMRGLLAYVFNNTRPKMSNGVTNEKSLAELKKRGILGHFEAVKRPFQRRDMRGLGARFLVALFDDKTKVCPGLGPITTAQASLGHKSMSTSAIYLSYPFAGDEPDKIGEIAMDNDKRKVTLYSEATTEAAEVSMQAAV